MTHLKGTTHRFKTAAKASISPTLFANVFTEHKYRRKQQGIPPIRVSSSGNKGFADHLRTACVREVLH